MSVEFTHGDELVAEAGVASVSAAISPRWPRCARSKGQLVYYVLRGASTTRLQISKRVDLEVIRSLGITDGDVPGNTFVESRFGEQAEGCCKVPLAIAALLIGALKDHCWWHLKGFGHQVSFRGSRFGIVTVGGRRHMIAFLRVV
jgi:hypothetical protein